MSWKALQTGGPDPNRSGNMQTVRRGSLREYECHYCRCEKIKMQSSNETLPSSSQWKCLYQQIQMTLNSLDKEVGCGGEAAVSQRPEHKAFTTNKISGDDIRGGRASIPVSEAHS